MTATRLPNLTEKVQTPFGPIHVCVDAEGGVRFARNDRLTDSNVDQLLTLIETTVNSMIGDMRP